MTDTIMFTTQVGINHDILGSLHVYVACDTRALPMMIYYSDYRRTEVLRGQ